MRHLELKAILLLVAFVLALSAAAGYLLYARGAFEPTQQVVLMTDDAEGVTIGMDMTFAGFPIGRVARTELAEDGQVRILVDVPTKDARWLRTSSVVTLEKGVVGGAKLKAFSGVLDDPPLPDGAQLLVLRGDITAEIPKLMNQAHEVLQNVAALTASEGSLGRTLSDLQAVSGRLSGRQGVLGGLMGNEDDARKLVQTIDSANALLARLNTLSGKADSQVFGQGGVVPGAQQTVRELTGLLVDARESLKKVDQVLADATVISGNAKDASSDLGALRSEVEANLRKVERLINQLNRTWPFAPKQQEVKLP
ncbi:mammalian cell entry protein [Comamonas serinivorans]|uniref:Mammalian cell entry protein n=1 Tax=Comamonas serinivorans TaxID=1082851 RepID=A0A1Y0ET68_9BURK|nr:mammalian cell entry protein [Comamonas serinivorans]